MAHSSMHFLYLQWGERLFEPQNVYNIKFSLACSLESFMICTGYVRLVYTEELLPR